MTDRDLTQRVVAALEGIERHLRVIAAAPTTETAKRARRAALKAVAGDRFVAVPYVPGEGCDCPPPWGGEIRINPDCIEHGKGTRP